MADSGKEEEIKKFASECSWDEVLKLYNEVYPGELIVEQEEGWSVQLTLNQKADIMSSMGKFEEALQIKRTCLDMATRENGEKSREALQYKMGIASLLSSLKKGAEAVELLTQVLEDQIELFGDTPSETNQDAIETRYALAFALEREGELHEALLHYECVYDAYFELYPETDLSAHVGFHVISLKLRIAAEHSGDLSLETILKIVGYGPTVLTQKSYGKDGDGKDTVIHRAVRSGVVQIVKVVLEDMLAQCEGDADKVRDCLNFVNSENQSPLTLAVKYGYEDVVKYLLENWIGHGLEINRCAEGYYNALLAATYENNEPIKKLLQSYGAVLRPKSEAD